MTVAHVVTLIYSGIETPELLVEARVQLVFMSRVLTILTAPRVLPVLRLNDSFVVEMSRSFPKAGRPLRSPNIPRSKQTKHTVTKVTATVISGSVTTLTVVPLIESYETVEKFLVVSFVFMRLLTTVRSEDDGTLMHYATQPYVTVVKRVVKTIVLFVNLGPIAPVIASVMVALMMNSVRKPKKVEKVGVQCVGRVCAVIMAFMEPVVLRKLPAKLNKSVVVINKTTATRA